MDDLRAAVLLQAMGPERVLEFAAFDTPIRMHLPYAATDAVQRIILLSNTFYETHQMAAARQLIRPGSVIVDAGANIGNHTLFFAKVCGASEVHAFEPLRTIFAILKQNVALNGLVNVHCHNMALGAVAGRGSLAHFPTQNIAASQFKLAGGTDYPVMPLDALPLDRLDLLKIDVEGTQVTMLEGARETVQRHRPLIWIELRAKHGEFEPGDAMLRSLGYRQLQALSTVDFLYAPEP
ncbi:methyltransferase [Neoroseomonas lacus]|uniref:Methyltransferase n=2 Tax=Neoroseomonas lacus TaxID=287609 RepID=A0A917NID3_9PROT|nr:methyltransferase [Neoroseomonas lacus]